MPLSDHEQRILEEIERRLAEEDPRLAEQVANTSLYSHLARRIRWASLTFVVGFLMLLLFGLWLWVAAAGFALMLLSTLMIYRYLKQMGRDQVRALQQHGGRFSLAAFLARMTGRFRGPHIPPSE
jgi:ABC-type bacteriocin/lantibiotic exporter with double-glycine peptidase domain